MNKTLTCVLAWVIILQTAVQPLVSGVYHSRSSVAYASSNSVNSGSEPQEPSFDSEPMTQEAIELNRVATLIENASENSLPPEKIKDSFHLVDQWVLKRRLDGSFQEYHLMNLSQDPPTIVPPDFHRDIRITLDSKKGNLNFEFIRNGEVDAIHQVRGIHPVLYSKDRELLVFLTEDKKAHVMDMAYIQANVFKSVLPVVDLTTVPIDLSQIDQLKTTFLKRSLKPVDTIETAPNALIPMDVDPNLVRYQAGDFIIYRTQDDGTRVREAQLDRATILTDLSTAEAILVSEVLALAPNPELNTLAAKLNKILKSAEDKKAMETVSQADDLWTKAFISRISPQSIENLVARAQRNKAGSQELRDEFTLKEWLSHFQKLRSNEKAQVSNTNPDEIINFSEVHQEIMQTMGATGNNSITPLSVLRSALHSKGMRIVAAVTALGGGTGLAAYSLGLDQIPEFTALGAWIVFTLNDLYENFIPQVLKDQKYRWTLLKSTIALSTLPVIVWFGGKMTAIVQKRDWPGFKVIAAASFQVYAFTFLPVYNWLATLSKQENFLKAMRFGVNPMTEVKPDSALGKAFSLTDSVRPAIRASAAQSERNESLLKAMLDQKNRVRALTWQLALMVVSQRYRIDPGTLAVLMEKGPRFNGDQLDKIATDPYFQKAWKDLAEEIHFSLSSRPELSLTEDISKIDAAELAKYYRIAEDTAQKMKKRTQLESFWSQMRVKWSQLSENFMTGVGNFGLSEYRDLRGWEPSQKDVVNPFVQQFLIDYYFTVFQMAVVGARANLDRPHELAAEYYHPSMLNLWTNRVHLADMVDQVRVYGLSLPASMALTFQRTVPVVDTSYHPLEETTLKGHSKKEGFWRSLTDWTKGATNLAEANYGGTFKRDLLKRFRTIQAGIIMVIFLQRMIFGGQGFVDATIAYVYTFAWAMWGFGWIWPILNRGNQVYRDRIDTAEAQFREAKTLLGRGIRLENMSDFKAGFEALSKIWAQSAEQLPEQMKKWVETSLSILNQTPPSELSEFQAQNHNFAAATEEIHNGIILGNTEMIDQGKNKLQEILLKDGSLDSSHREMILQMTGADLLQYSMKHPPVATQPNSTMELLTNVVGSFVSTYLYTTMAVISFSKETNWSVVLPTTIGMSVALYTGIFQLQKAIDWLVQGNRMSYIGKRIAPVSMAFFLSAGASGLDQFGFSEAASKLADRAASLREIPTEWKSLNGEPKNSVDAHGNKHLPGCEGLFLNRTF